MIQIDAIRIQEFRGIRDLELELNSKSFVVWGPNGSGKSGVVDAIDFALTGDISRLAGKGTGGLSVQKHGPHVHRRDDPGAAVVTLTVRETASGKSAVLTRSVKTAKTYSLSPDLPEVRAAVDQAQQHPELTLSRREVIKYILAEPGARAQQVQALLKLDRIGEIRSLLRTTQSKTSSLEKAAETEVKSAEEAVRRHLDLSTLLRREVTTEINRHRAVLGLEPFDAVSTETDLLDGVDATPTDGSFNKASAIRDVDSLVESFGSATLSEHAAQLLGLLREVQADPTVLESIQMRTFIDAGSKLVVAATCPLCDSDWDDADALRAHLTAKLARLDAAAALAGSVEQTSRSVVDALTQIRARVRGVVPHASLGPAQFSDRLQRWAQDLAAFEAHLGTVGGALAQVDRLESDLLAMPPNTLADLESVRLALESKPDQSASTSARTFLTIAQERWTRLRLGRAAHDKAAAAHAAATFVYSTFCEVADVALAGLYQAVQDKFGEYYRAINADDEVSFKAELEPSAGKLDLSVDFYGIGMFPPAAYHSEGHQDGMGVCLYLALVEQLLGNDFRFAVLDDVVMSVDSSHRRQFCKLLKDQFPEVQFVITTHDEVWARQMQASGLVTKSAQAQFRGWTVDAGPVYEVGQDFWDKIEADLAQNSVSAAAACLRRNLESIMTDLAANIHGQVAFRPDGNYELGELLSAVKGRHGKLLAKASASADSWKNTAGKKRVAALKKERAAAVLAQEGENWTVNSAVHFNEWATFSKADFLPVVEAWKQFLALFRCTNPDCSSWIYVSGPPGNEEALRCSCGTFDVNLRT